MKPSSAIYRIMDIGDLLGFCSNKRNYLSDPKNWEDPWEKLELEDRRLEKRFGKQKEKIFAQCWTRKGYSWALWKMNSPSANGVRIKTSVQKLFESLPKKMRRGRSQSEFVKDVRYTTGKSIKDELRTKLNGNRIGRLVVKDLFYLKRSAFDYEEEVRLIVCHDGHNTGLSVRNISGKRFLTYKVDPLKLIETFYFDTKMKRNLFNLYRDTLVSLGFSPRQIKRSSIFRKPSKIKI